MSIKLSEEKIEHRIIDLYKSYLDGCVVYAIIRTKKYNEEADKCFDRRNFVYEYFLWIRDFRNTNKSKESKTYKIICDYDSIFFSFNDILISDECQDVMSNLVADREKYPGRHHYMGIVE